MKIERFDCPYCKQPIETDAETARRGLNCPTCFKFFQPDIPNPKINTPTRSETTQKEKLKERAHLLSGLSLLAFVLGCFCLFLTLLYYISPDNGMNCMYAVYILIGSAIYLWLMAQLIHIRANTEK